MSRGRNLHILGRKPCFAGFFLAHREQREEDWSPASNYKTLPSSSSPACALSLSLRDSVALASSSPPRSSDGLYHLRCSPPPLRSSAHHLSHRRRHLHPFSTLHQTFRTSLHPRSPAMLASLHALAAAAAAMMVLAATAIPAGMSVACSSATANHGHGFKCSLR